ncbi:MAG: hypothetical protein ABEJ56_03010 [Candidatus Nanohaloarchaea archaeon]
MTSDLDSVDQALEGEASGLEAGPVVLEGSGTVELYSLDQDPRAGPGAYDSVQDYAHGVASDPTITDPVVNDLAEGLKAGQHNSHTEEVFDQHQTVHHPDGTAHYNEESGAWRDYQEEESQE